jgi:nitric oxide reductase NorQ protein
VSAPAVGTFPPVAPRPLVETPPVREVVERALTYLRCGYPVHLSGPAGTGKTTLALHLAHRLERPCVFIQGDEQLTSVDLVRGSLGFRRVRVIDNYIRTVVRREDDYTERWADNWLAVACRHGYTLVYDEFTRSRAETNNVLLSVLEERVLVVPGSEAGTGVLPVHPEFRAIFTSNPAEYVGVHRAPDALQDRLLTIRLERFDPETEVAIVRAHSGLPEAECRRLVGLVRAVRDRGKGSVPPSLRAAVTLSRILAATGRGLDLSDPAVVRFCHDVFGPPATASPQVLAEILAEEASGRGGDGNRGRG